MKTIKVLFKNDKNKGYKYLCPYEVSVGNFVVVDSPYNGYVTVEVIKIYDGEEVAATKRVVCVVDDTDYLEYNKRKEKEKRLLLQLDKAAAEFNKLALYEMAAKSDSKVAALLKELKSL